MLKNIIFLLFLNATLFSSDVDSYHFHFHGNFCGAKFPLIVNKTKKEELEILKEIQAIDVIDEACKNHDICYLDSKMKKSVCDQRLVLEIKKIDHKLVDRSCRRLAQSINYFFTLKTDNPITVIESDNSLKNKILMMPSVTLSNILSSASIASVAAVNYMYRKPHGYIFDSKNNDDRSKEILQILPNRHKVCKLK